MTPTTTRALTLSRPVIRGLTVLNLLYGMVITALLVSSVFRADWPFVPLGFERATAHPGIALGLRAIMMIGLVGIAIVHTILRRLLAIVDTARDGDPFIADNVRRLHAIAWSVLAIEGLRLIVAAIAMAVSTPGQSVGMGGGYSVAPWLAVLLLFVLAGVFARGARMRADLEGTV